MNIPKNLLYTKEHEWVKLEGAHATMGITDHAQAALGGITFFEGPTVGQVAQQTKQVATVESVKAASDVYAPLSGKVTGVNDTLSEKPELINQSPYEQGWMVKLEIADEKEKDTLLTPQAYQEYLQTLS